MMEGQNVHILELVHYNASILAYLNTVHQASQWVESSHRTHML